MKHKVEQLTEAIKAKVDELGLMFVDGPNLTAVDLAHPSFSNTDGQERAVYLIAVAERE